jgi:hypothetical protein
MLCLGPGAQAAPGSGDTPSKVDFNRDIRPIITENCFKCHGPDDGARKSNLRFDVRAEALKPAKSGKVAIVPKAPEKSELIARITATDEDDRMPPLKTGKKLSPGQIETLRRWIAQGAPYATHWAYVKPVRPALPQMRNRRWSRNPIDNFILARLEREGLQPSPEADRYTLIRRVSLDLTGLPPTVDDVDQFVNDRKPRAYEELVDRLLGNKAYGEHWARMWLDLARYADSAGYADDPGRVIWAYRDWVIRAFNANLPFDRFTLEQIAGDLLDDSDEDDQVATAFHRNTMTNNEGGTTDEEFRNAAVVDRVNTTMEVWMATSMGCAQCHNHKYDPITQQDYFRLFAILNNTEDADLRDESPVLKLYTAPQKEERARLQSEIDPLEKQLKTISPDSLAHQVEWEARYPRAHHWLPLAPTVLKANAGGSIVAAESNAAQFKPLQRDETYTLEAPISGKLISGLSLETLAALPNREPGQAINAGFAITHVTASLVSAATNRFAGRYVRVELRGKKKILSLAEVQVFNGSQNIATNGEASQSSTAFEGAAQRAIDGNTDGDYETAKSTTHTEESKNPWWEVDLKSLQPIDRIVLWNRTDNGLQNRLSDFHLLVLDEQRKPIWEKTVPEPPNPSSSFAMDGSQAVQFVAAFADLNPPGSDVKSVLDGKKPGWALEPDDTKWRRLSLLPARPVPVPAGSKLLVTIKQEALHDHCPPAQVKLSVSEDEHISEYASVPGSVMEILVLPAVERNEEQRSSLAHYYRANVDPSLKPEREKMAQLNKQLADMQPNTVPVMRELTGTKRRKTHIQFRGNYLALGDEVTEATPASFHPLPKGSKPDRLGLARWLLDQDNPLTARVTVNRFWEQIFGTGIVRTCEDFGTQGDRPTHPELLDWLATEFVAQNWDVKAFLKMLVTSATYRQSSRVTPQLRERDPENLLLARGPRFRAPAEIVRDQSLAVSGLLSHKMYGPPVRPPQPSLGLNAAFGSTFDWKPSTGEDRYRRAVYTEWRRTSPYPSMATFDAPNREVCALRRPRSNTPLQALVTLNDPVYVEAAQALATRMDDAADNLSDKARYGFRLCLARAPRPAELKQLVDLFNAARADFASKPEEAKKMAVNPLQPALPENKITDLAAWTAVANVLVNLDETLMKP